ncbi:hypothetical protein [Thiocystis violacea]|nr:hypothetical protein [Thiocystis violacea]
MFDPDYDDPMDAIDREHYWFAAALLAALVAVCSLLIAIGYWWGASA